jgi:hypothetical protein
MKSGLSNDARVYFFPFRQLAEPGGGPIAASRPFAFCPLPFALPTKQKRPHLSMKPLYKNNVEV